MLVRHPQLTDILLLDCQYVEVTEVNSSMANTLYHKCYESHFLTHPHPPILIASCVTPQSQKKKKGCVTLKSLRILRGQNKNTKMISIKFYIFCVNDAVSRQQFGQSDYAISFARTLTRSKCTIRKSSSWDSFKAKRASERERERVGYIQQRLAHLSERRSYRVSTEAHSLTHSLRGFKRARKSVFSVLSLKNPNVSLTNSSISRIFLFFSFFPQRKNCFLRLIFRALSRLHPQHFLRQKWWIFFL